MFLLFDIFRKLFTIFNSKEKKAFKFMILFSSIVSILEVISIGILIPYLTIASDKKIILNNNFLKKIYSYLDKYLINDLDTFFYLFSFAILIFFVMNGLLRLSLIFYFNKFIFNFERDFSNRLLTKYLSRPYIWLINQDISDLKKNILSEVNIIANKILIPLTLFLSNIFFIIFIFITLTFINTILILTLTIIFLLFGYVIYYFLRTKIQLLGLRRKNANTGRFRTIDDIFELIKELKISNYQNFFIKNYYKHSNTFANSQASANFLGLLPKYVLESLVVIFFIISIVFIELKNFSLTESLPLFFAFAVATLKLLPSFNQCVTSFLNIKFSSPSLNLMINEFKKLITHEIKSENLSHLNNFESLEIVNGSFFYPNSNTGIKNLNLKINKNTTNVFFGKNGSGKSTCLNLLTGLLELDKGEIKFNNINISYINKESYYSLIGYVPQTIYFLNDSIIRNIALGIEDKKIDFDRIIKVAKISSIHDFIMNDLKDGYQTLIGDDGIKLSGGQRQCIGLARCLYLNPKILFLDEFTSSIDTDMEKKIINNLISLKDEITLIVVSHNNEVKNYFENLYEFNGGSVKYTNKKY